MMDITMIDKTGQVTDKEQNLVSDLLQTAGKVLSLDDETEMSVTFVDNHEIQEINREFRHKDMPTDVISFAIEDEGEGEPDIVFPDGESLDMPQDLGDIFISIDRAHEQAEEYGHTYERELGFLAVHGFLHLNGFDHMTPEDEEEMFSLQRKILDSYGLQR